MTIFFSGWDSLARTLVVGTLAYVSLVVFLRVSGNRTLSKMNAFDFVVTVALGSTLASALLTKDVAVADGALAFALLIGLQFLVTWSSTRAAWVKRLVTGDPQLLFYKGEYLEANIRRARVTHDEVRAAARAAGCGSMNDADAVVLETDGSFSVVRGPSDAPHSTLEGVSRS